MRDRQVQRPAGGKAAPTRSSRSKRIMFRRTVFLMFVCGVLFFAPLFWKLWDIAIVHHEDYQQKATSQQTMDLSVSASRGDIYDRNGNVMAMSATVYTLVVSPRDLVASVDKKDFIDEETEVLDQAAYDAAVEARQNKIIRDLLSMVEGLEEERVTSQVMDVSKAYKEIKVKIEEVEAETIRSYIVENKTSAYLYLISGTKRYYPYSSLAAQVLGFVNANGGAYGIEAIYDDILEGTAGRVVTTKTAKGEEMYNSYSQFIDAIDGYNVTLTLDETIQSYVEKTLEEGIKDFDVRNGAFGIAMSPKTGEILAIASSPDFDPNNYSLVTDSLLNEKMESDTQTIYQQLKANNTENLTEAELMAKAEGQAYSNAVNTQWRNKAVDSRYEPGSTFKAVVLAAALEENLVDENDTFMCTGSLKVAGYPKAISCSKKEGHGLQTLAQAVQNSCNPAFIQIGQRLGVETFYDYFEAFGMTESSGIDLPGEADPVEGISYWDRDVMTGVDLAVASFGQRFTVTPLQMISAFATTINGGNLVQPYVVQSVTTQDGTVVQNTQPNIVRQVVSEETSQRATKILESVVSEGTGKNAYVAGYRIGGKTGSSETGEKGRTIVSFMGFAPAEDPEVIVLLAYDKPQESATDERYSTTGVYISGGNMAAKKAGPLIAQILDYMGVEKKYTKEESAAVDVTAPKVVGKTVEDAAEALEKKNLKYRTIGEGSSVTSQIPAANVNIPGGSTVILYLGDAVPEEMAVMPDVVGLSYEAARQKLEENGFFMRSSGVSVYYGNTTTAENQSIVGGESAPLGTVVDVTFTNVVEDGWVDPD